MKKVVIIGCESSHSELFLNLLKCGYYPEIEIAGVYCDDIEIAKKISENYKIKIMSEYDEAVSYADGVMIMARDGGKHYKYALPYIKEGVTMFIDKPFTIDENEAVELVNRLRESNVRVTGGSCCKYIEFIQKLKKEHIDGKNDNKTVGGFVRAPIFSNNSYGGFFFYSPHLVEMICEIYGYNPISVKAFENNGNVTAILRYKDFDVTALFVEGSDTYFAYRCSMKSVTASEIFVSNDAFKAVFDEFYMLLLGGKQMRDYDSFAAPVKVLSAIKKTIEIGE